jgi:hypothetical protein
MKSAKIVQFPRRHRADSITIDPVWRASNVSHGPKQAHRSARWKMTLGRAVGSVWLLIGLLWPLLNWMGALDVLFQWASAFYYSNNPDSHATLRAVLHTAGYFLLSAFVYLYRPKVF